MRTIRECNVAVVGGAGFLGSHLVDHLIEDRGCNVLVIDNLVAGRREFVHPKARFEHHDITGSESYLLSLFKQHKSQFVMNYSAWPYIVDSFARPIHVADVNFMGAMKVINAAHEAGCDGILQVSSAEIYGGGPYTKEMPNWPCESIDEDETVDPHSSYGVSKAAVDNWVQVRWREAKTPCIALRQFNCVGERETHPYIVPEIIGQLAKQQNFQPNPPQIKGLDKWGSPKVGTVHLGNNSFRDFMYAGDAVRIAIELLERGELGQVYNLGSETGIKMYDLAKLIGKLVGFAEVKVERDESRVRPFEIWHLQSDNMKISNAINMKIAEQARGTIVRGAFNLTPLETALRKTIDWYEGNGRRWGWEK